MKQTLKIGVTVLVVAGLVMSGIALAQGDQAPSDEVAVADTAAFQGILERLAPLVEEGTISESQAEAVAEHLARGMRPDRPRRGFEALRAAVEFLGLEPGDLREAFEKGMTLAEMAEASGSSGAELVGFLVGLVDERLAEAVAEGKITEKQKAEALSDAEARFTELVDGEIRLPRPHDRPRPHGRGPEVLGAVVEFLGLEPGDVRTAAGEGMTLAELAEANGSSGAELVGFLVGLVDERLSQAVADGKITDEQKAEALGEAEARFTDLMDDEIRLPRPGDRPHDRPRDHRRDHRPGRDAPFDTGATDSA